MGESARPQRTRPGPSDAKRPASPQRTMSRVPPSLFPRRLSSAFRTNVSQSRILLPCSGICRQMPELFFARRTVLRGTRRPQLCGDFFGERRGPKTKTPRTTCKRSSPGQADARTRGRPDLRGRSIAEPAHDAVRSDAPVHGGRLLRRCCRAFEPDDASARRGPFPGKLLPESCPEPEKAAAALRGLFRRTPGPRACAGFFAQETAPVRKVPRNAARQRRPRPLPADAALPVFMKKDRTRHSAPHGHGRAKSDAFAHGAAPAAPEPRGLGKNARPGPCARDGASSVIFRRIPRESRRSCPCRSRPWPARSF